MTHPPPPPGLPQAPMVSTEGLKVGDVVQIAVQLLDRDTQKPFWWKRFAVVMSIPRRLGRPSHRFQALTLKMHPDLDADLREVEFGTDANARPQVVTKLPEPWPQGVAAMHMKLLAQGIIKLEGDE